MTITSASLAAEGGTAQTLAVPDGSTVLRIPDGAASIKYTLTVQARYQKSDGSLKNLTFTYVLRYSGDVSLELRYTLLNGTQTAIRCANGQNKTAQTVYSDEVTDGVLAYTLALTGGDAASGVEISDVSCYQSGSGKTKALGSAESGQIELLVNADGSEGENTFTITAKSEPRICRRLSALCRLTTHPAGQDIYIRFPRYVPCGPADYRPAADRKSASCSPYPPA